MCCNKNRAGRPARQPLLLALGTAAYAAYQNRKASKSAPSLPAPQTSQQREDTTLSSTMDSLNLDEKKVDPSFAEPPSYEVAIGEVFEAVGKGKDKAMVKREYDSESSSESEVQEMSPCARRKVERRERRAAWRAEKAARKAASGRRGCCC